ncbi:MAG: hypothetical protein WD009_07960 [Phycisphaeraceae bacterium]
MRIATLLLAASLGFAAAGGVAHAQGRPDPPRLDADVDAPDIALFERAYEAAGEPTILILAGRTSSTGQERAVAGRPGADRHAGAGINLLDNAGDAQQLRLEIERLLRQRPGVELVSLDALSERARREAQQMNMRDERRALDLLGSEINAELAVVIRMLQSPQVAGHGARYRVSVEIIDVPRARSIGGFGFDWMQGNDARTINAYAEQITRRFVEQLANWYVRPDGQAPARRYTVRLVGVDDVEQLVKARNAFEQIDHVQRVRDGGMSADGLRSIASLTIDHGGRPLDLMLGLQQAARDELGMRIDATDGSAGTITLVAEPAVSRLPRWTRLVVPTHREHEQARAELAEQYEAQGRPRVGIVISRALSEAERRHPRYRDDLAGLDGEADNEAGSVVTVNIATTSRRPRPGEPALDLDAEARALLDTRQMEDTLYKRMLDLGLVMVDPARVRSSLAEQVDAERELFREDELMRLVGQSADIDILVHGVGRIDAAGSVRYTFRTVRLNDGSVLAADSWSSDLPVFSGSAFRRGTMEFAAAYAAGSMLDQALSFWQPPQRISVSVTGARDQRDVFAVMNALDEQVDTIVSVDFDRHEEDTGRFNLRYTGSYEQLVGAINAQADQLPLRVDATGSTRDSLSLRLTDPLADAE